MNTRGNPYETSSPTQIHNFMNNVYLGKMLSVCWKPFWTYYKSETANNGEEKNSSYYEIKVNTNFPKK